MIESGEKDGQKISYEDQQRQKDEVQEVVRYCQNITDCRRTMVMGYFGEQFSPHLCKNFCDNCVNNSGAEMEDFTEVAGEVIKLVKNIIKPNGRYENYTINHCMEVFRGSQNKTVREKGHASLQGAGAGKDMERDQVERLFNHLINKEALVHESIPNKSGWHTTYVRVCIFY